MEASIAVKPPSIAAIDSGIREYVESENRRRKTGPPQPHPYLYASSRRKCLRRSVYECTHPELMPEFDTNTKARFLRGEQREIDLRLELTRAGQLSEPRFDFIGAQEAVKIHDRSGRLIISGKIDGFIRWQSGEEWPVEIKSWHPSITDRIESFEDICNGIFTWSGAHQLLAYMYAKAVPFGMFALDSPGLPKLIGVELYSNLERIESFLQDAEECVDHIEAQTLPGFIQDAGECKRCQFFGSVCNPPLLSGEGAVVLTDPELEPLLDRREELRDAALEYDRIDADVKKKLRGIETGIAGKYFIEGKWGKATKYDIPEAVKKQYAIQDPKGRFTLSITKL